MTDDEIYEQLKRDLLDAAERLPHIKALIEHANGEIGIMVIAPNIRCEELPKDKPGIIYIPGDMPGNEFTPSMFDKTSLENVFRAPIFIVLQVAKPIPFVYATAVEMARSLSRLVLIVEIAEQHEIDWFNYSTDHSKAAILLNTPRNTGYVQ